MADLSRRRFLQTAAALVPASAVPGRALGAQSPRLDEETLTALGETVLPSELGAQGIQRVCAGFQRWLAEYRPAAEVNHGYGTDRVDYTPAHPGPGWAAQLEALNLESKERQGNPLSWLPVEQRREVIRHQLARDRLDRLPAPAEARHVAVGLLAYFYATPEANDLCYQASIGPYGCRPLETVAEKPTALGQGS